MIREQLAQKKRRALGKTEVTTAPKAPKAPKASKAPKAPKKIEEQ